MGYMTPFMFLNDGIHLLKKDSNKIKFCNDIVEATCNIEHKNITISIDNFCNPVTALRSMHADIGRILYCGQNSFFDILDVTFNNIESLEFVANEAIRQGKELKRKVKELKLSKK